MTMRICRARDLLGRQTSEPSTAQLAQAYRLPYKLGADKARGTVTVADAKGTTYAAEELVVRYAAQAVGDMGSTQSSKLQRW